MRFISLVVLGAMVLGCGDDEDSTATGTIDGSWSMALDSCSVECPNLVAVSEADIQTTVCRDVPASGSATLVEANGQISRVSDSGVSWAGTSNGTTANLTSDSVERVISGCDSTASPAEVWTLGSNGNSITRTSTVRWTLVCPDESENTCIAQVVATGTRQ